jgi:uncharacterized membrane protein
MTTDTTRHLTRRPLISAGTLLGIGLGGFVDGIVLHQNASGPQHAVGQAAEGQHREHGD